MGYKRRRGAVHKADAQPVAISTSKEDRRIRNLRQTKPVVSKKVKMFPNELLSPIEQLPLELIETIFLYSMEVSFPLASPLIGRALSSSWLLNQVAKRADQLSVSAFKRVLAARFCTPQYFNTNNLAFIGWRQSFARSCHEKFSPANLQGLRTKTGELYEMIKDFETIMPPARFTHTNWTADMLEMWVNLESVRNFQAYVVEEQDLPRMLGFAAVGTRKDQMTAWINQAALEAIKRNDYLAIVHILRTPCRRMLGDEVPGITSCVDLPQPGYTLPATMLRHAIIEHGCDLRMVLLLLTAQMVYSPRDNANLKAWVYDPVVYRWAESNGAGGRVILYLFKIINEWLLASTPRVEQNAPVFLPKQMKGLFSQVLDGSSNDHLSSEVKAAIQQAYEDYEWHSRVCWGLGNQLALPI
jgi:hypothetical protein